jgi:polyhydroxyalkanoate synthesis regulator phasin
MAEKAQAAVVKPGVNSGAPAIKRGPGHRAVDARDAIAELTERAQEISLEAGSKVAIAMKDVISAAAGLAGFAVESARDLVQFMIRRGQMTQDEGDKLLREAEAAHSKRPAAERRRPTASEVSTKERAAARAKAAAARERAMAAHMLRMPARPASAPKKAAPVRAKSAKSAKSSKSAKGAKASKRASKPARKSGKRSSKRR